MRKATSQKEKTQAAPVKLGTKRACIKCGTKFYDFGKEEVNCPKCNAKLRVAELNQAPSLPVEPKKSKAVEKVAPEALMQSDDAASETADDTFESVEDLADEEEDLVDDLDVDDEKEDY